MLCAQQDVNVVLPYISEHNFVLIPFSNLGIFPSPTHIIPLNQCSFYSSETVIGSTQNFGFELRSADTIRACRSRVSFREFAMSLVA